MGREVRKVAANWEHPKVTDRYVALTERVQIGSYIPLYDEDFESAAAKWKSDYAKWYSGEDAARAEHLDTEYWEWSGGPPDRKSYRPKWTEAERTHYQLYETVTEGTPLSPHFSTLEELARWLAANGDYWSQLDNKPLRSFAEWMSFLRVGWAPTGIYTPASGKYEPGHIAIANDAAEGN